MGPLVAIRGRTQRVIYAPERTEPSNRAAQERRTTVFTRATSTRQGSSRSPPGKRHLHDSSKLDSRSGELRFHGPFGDAQNTRSFLRR